MDDRYLENDACGLEFVPNEDTLFACEEIEKIIKGDIPKKIYHSFEEMWSDICET